MAEEWIAARQLGGCVIIHSRSRETSRETSHRVVLSCMTKPRVPGRKRGGQTIDWKLRFAAAWKPNEAGCHIWQRGVCGSGYGTFCMEGRNQLAHRVAWFQAHGEWPTPGLVVDHLCEIPLCVNPDHLTVTDTRTNILRSPRHPYNVARTRTACTRGHAFSSASVYVDPKGRRHCRVCRKLLKSLRGEAQQSQSQGALF